MERSNGSVQGVTLNRRQFMQSMAAAGVGYMLSQATLGQTAPASGSADAVKVALLGVGSQGYNLLNDSLKIPGLQYVAVCDIWPFMQKRAAGVLKKRGFEVNVYEDYRQMLEKEKGLDAVIVATPDWMHSEHAVACLQAGCHVYCEKEMSNTLEGARAMVQAARQTKKLLQIGHQRRSNPRYQHSLKLIEKDNVLGRITTINGQWNRPVAEDFGWPKSEELDQATLGKYGYENMFQFRNWRWFRKYSGGPIVDLGSHQIDVFNWYLHATPKAVIASGGLDYAPYKSRQWYDNVMAIYEYDTPAGVVRAFYEVVNTSSYGGYYEAFMGDQGTLVISEDTTKGFVFREVAAPKRDWEKEAQLVNALGRGEAVEIKVSESLKATSPTEAAALEAQAAKPPHQLHMENFFDAVRKGTPLSCPAEVGYETAVTVLRVNEAVEKGTRLTFQPEQFKV